MNETFIKYIEDNKLINPTDKILLAVSGGIDSMVMANIFLECGLSFSIAHCNFNLRGAESDGDQGLVEKFAKTNNVKLHIQAFQTTEFAEENNISIQMAARELRYNWFNQLREEHKYTKIATAHNSDDNVETFFLNLLRGTGLNGLTGIEINNNNIIRPLLFASRKDITDYCNGHNVQFREDSSNKVNKYARNKIRLDILPSFETIRPNFKQKMLENMDYIKQVNSFVEAQLKSIYNKYTRKESNLVYIDTNIAKEENAEYILFQILHKYGFKGKIIKQIAASLSGESGKQFFSDTHTLTKDRDYLIVSEQENVASEENYFIYDDFSTDTIQQLLTFRVVGMDENYKISKDSEKAQLSLEKLKFPLILRKWKEGDSFTPLGMKGNKKVSDFLIDEKTSLLEKEKQLVLVSDNNIVWLVGKRIDNRYKIDSSTKKILVIEQI